MSETVSLRELIDQRFELEAEARKIALEAMDRRLDGMNEFRGTLQDQSNRMISRDEFNAVQKELEGRLRVIETFKDAQQGGTSQTARLIGLAFLGIAVVNVVLGIVFFLVTRRTP